MNLYIWLWFVLSEKEKYQKVIDEKKIRCNSYEKNVENIHYWNTGFGIRDAN